ncbi:MAG: hypothetical protein ACI9S8_002182 [Chlamydiales bacterium]|jgi:hypothetical protein
MESKAVLPEPMADIGSFQIDHNLYGEVNRIHLQDALRTLYEKILITEGDRCPLKDLEDYIKQHPRKFDKKIISDAFEILELPLEEEAYTQCRMDTLEEARNEVRDVVENMGTPNYEAVMKNVLGSGKTDYVVQMQSKRFISDQNEEGIKSFFFDFSERLVDEVEKELNFKK